MLFESRFDEDSSPRLFFPCELADGTSDDESSTRLAQACACSGAAGDGDRAASLAIAWYVANLALDEDRAILQMASAAVGDISDHSNDKPRGVEFGGKLWACVAFDGDLRVPETFEGEEEESLTFDVGEYELALALVQETQDFGVDFEIVAYLVDRYDGGQPVSLPLALAAGRILPVRI